MTKVTILPANIEFECAADEAILDAAERHGINMPYRCRQGVCTSCVCKLIAGQVSYPGVDESGLMLVRGDKRYAYACIGVAETDITLSHPFIE